MLDSSPYQPPESDLGTVGGDFAFRDGDLLLARDGYLSSKICIVTGQEVNLGTKPVKVLYYQTEKKDLWLGILIALLLFFGVFPTFISHLNFREIMSLGVGVFLLSTCVVLLVLAVFFLHRPKCIRVFVAKSIELSQKRRKRMYLVCLFGVIFSLLMILYESLMMLSESYYVIAILLLLSSGIALLKFLPAVLIKKIKDYDGYAVFKGAHPRFLDHLPPIERDGNADRG